MMLSADQGQQASSFFSVSASLFFHSVLSSFSVSVSACILTALPECTYFPGSSLSPLPLSPLYLPLLLPSALPSWRRGPLFFARGASSVCLSSPPVFEGLYPCLLCPLGWVRSLLHRQAVSFRTASSPVCKSLWAFSSLSPACLLQAGERETAVCSLPVR